MNSKKIYRPLLPFLIILGLLAGLMLFPLDVSQSKWPGVQSVQAQDLISGKIYIPLVASSPQGKSIFGIEMGNITPEGGLDYVAQADTSWVRRNALMWDAVEKTEGNYDWSAVAGLDAELSNAAEHRFEVVLVVRSTPAWAQRIANVPCGQIKPEKYAAFANFLFQAIRRYSVPPYNVRYWQVWNEPDVPVNSVPPDMVYGCWGDSKDPYYGGGIYADVLKVVYPKMKQANPQVKVVIGGLLLPCDLNNKLGCHTKATKYLEGVLYHNGANDGGKYFDGVAFHAYDDYISLGKFGNGGWATYGSTDGPVLTIKSRFIKGILNQYHVTGKFLINTESALRCGPTEDDPSCKVPNDPDFMTTKAYYVPQLYAAAIAENLTATIWYEIYGGWRETSLLNLDLTPEPAYVAYQFTQQELKKAQFVREIAEFPGLKGYEFNRSDRRVWVLWSVDGSSHTIALPETALGAWDVFGNSVSAGSKVSVDIKPIYLEWSP